MAGWMDVSLVPNLALWWAEQKANNLDNNLAVMLVSRWARPLVAYLVERKAGTKDTLTAMLTAASWAVLWGWPAAAWRVV